MISESMEKITQNYAEIKVADILTLGIDLIIKYRYGDGLITTVPIFQTYLHTYFGKKSQECSLLTAVKFYISTKDDIQILNVFEYPKKFYKMTDFHIEVIDKVENGSMTLKFVKIKNKKTGVRFEDWVKQEQISSLFLLNNLICWEIKGNEVFF